MRTLLLFAPLALLAGQGGVPQKAAAAQEVVSPEQKKLDELVERFNQKGKDVREAYEKATTDAEKAKIYAGMPGEDFVPAFRSLAVEVKGTDAAARAWLWVLRLDQDGSEGTAEIVETLLSEHMESDVLAELGGYLQSGQRIGQGPTLEALQAMIDGSSRKKVLASALFSKGSILLSTKSESSQAEGRKCLERVVAEFPGLESGRGTYAEQAAGFLFELDHLQIGKSAPDFEAVDENGVKWKLSDYRGKVVVVDFWGFW